MVQTFLLTAHKYWCKVTVPLLPRSLVGLYRYVPVFQGDGTRITQQRNLEVVSILDNLLVGAVWEVKHQDNLEDKREHEQIQLQ